MTHPLIAKLFTATFLVGLSTLPLATAATLAVNYGGNYVDPNTVNLSGSISTTLSGNTRIDVYGDPSLTNVLSPTSNYTGPKFYGAAALTATLTGGGILAPTFTTEVFNSGATDPIRVVLLTAVQSGVNSNGAEFVVFKKEDFLNGLNATTVALDNTSVLSLDAGGALAARFGEGRFLVMNGGTMYLSQSSWNLSSTMPVTLDPTSTNWAVYSPTSTVLNFNQSSATFSAVTFDNVTALGVYGERDSVGSGGRFNLDINQFSATVVPEPTAMGLTLVGAAALLARRRRSSC